MADVNIDHFTSEEVLEINDKLPLEEDIIEISDLFKNFSDSTRVKILFALVIKELCVQDIADLFSMSQSAISHQLRVLRASRLVKARREGKNIFYSLDDDHIRDILNIGLEHVKEV